MSSEMKTIRVALDWTPNTIHSGLYVAQSKNLYAEAGLNVQLLPDPVYSSTPAKRLEANYAEVAIVPSESIIAYAESNKKNFHLQAIYAILQKDASAVVTAKDGYNRPRDLEDAMYGSYNARYEDAIVRAVISADGGDGSRLKIEGQTGKLSLFDAVKAGKIDATWIFLPWEGIEAGMEDVALKIFQAANYGIPYGYSPVIAWNSESGLSEEVLAKFVTATAKGYEMALRDPKVAIKALKEHCQPHRSKEFLKNSQDEINGYYSDGGEVGSMKPERWSAWVDWLKKHDLVKTTDLDTNEMFTNRFLS